MHHPVHPLLPPAEAEPWEPSPLFLRFALATLLIGCLSYLLSIRILLPDQTLRYIGPSLGAILSVIAYTLQHHGRSHAAIKLLAIGAWLVVSIGCIMQDGVYTPSVVAYPVIIILIGWLFNTRVATIMGALTALLLLGLLLAESRGWMTKDTPSPAIMYALFQVLLVFLAGFLINFITRSYQLQLQKLREISQHLAQRSQELEASQANLTISIETTGVVFWEYDLQHDRLKFDKAMLHWLNLDPSSPPENLTQWLTLVHPDDRRAFMDEFQRATQINGSPLELDYRLSAQHGDWVWVRTIGKVIQRNADGHALLASGGTLNITQRKQAEEATRRSETLLRSMLESTDEGILMVAKDGSVLAFNKRFVQLWQVPEELARLGKDHLLIAHVLEQLLEPEAFLSQVNRLYGSVEEARDTLLFKDGKVVSRYTQSLLAEGVLGRIWYFRDITLPTQSATALAASRQLLQLVIDTAPMRVFWKDRDLHYLGCNPAFAKDAGLTHPDQLIGKTDADLSWQAQADLYNADDRMVITTGIPKHAYDEPQTTPSGQTIWLRRSKVPLRNEKNETIGLLGIYEDITQFKIAEQALLQNNALLQSILDNIPVGLSAFDHELKLVAYNRLFCETLEFPLALFDGPNTTFEQIIGFNAERGEYGAGDAAQLMQSIVQRAQDPSPHQFERIRPNGSVLEICGSPMPGGGFVTTYVDITARKRAEAEIKNSEQLLRAAIDAIDEAFVLYGPDDRLVLCNDKYRRIYATSSDLIVPGASFEAIIRQGAERGQYQEATGRIDAWVAERLAKHRAANVNITQQLDDGHVLRIIERRMPDGSIVGFRVDITDLVQASKSAQEANLAKCRFLATMSHEIRTPMNGILGMAQLLLMPNLQDSERRDFARTILSSGQTLLTLLNDILDLSKIESGKFQLDDTVFDPNALMREIKTLFAGSAQAKNLHLDYQWNGPTGQRYHSDAHRLRQMLSNLLGNAIKFTAQGRIRVEGTEIERNKDTVLLEFAITDTGIGIAADKLDVLFKPFSQADSSTTREFGGSGLGLSIVKNLAQAMGGTVGVASELGQGSRFWFQINARVVLAEQNSRLNARDGSAPPRTELALKGHVLVAEDNPVNAMVIGALLNKLGLTHSVSQDGQQAVDAIRRGDRADLILMDLHMPVMDGYQATQHIRQWEAEQSRAAVPIVALTADAFEEDHQHCLAVGMNDFLTKPIALQTLVQILSKWLTLSPSSPAQCAPVTTLRVLDQNQFKQLVREITPMLMHNKFSSLGKLKELEELVVGTHLEADMAQISVLLQNFRFDLALERLQRVVL